MAETSTSEKITNNEEIYSISYENQRLTAENTSLKKTVEFYQKELDKFKQTPYVVCEVIKIIKGKFVIKLQNQNNFLVECSKEFDSSKIEVGNQVLCDQKSLCILDKIDLKLGIEKIESLVIINDDLKNNWNEIGGLTEEIEKVKEVLELPLKNPEIFKSVGIEPPKGVLLYGPPGTGKTLIAKTLAAQTNSTFIELIGSELVQKFIGDGARLVKELFEFARKKAPCIIFIDELDAIACKRIENGTSGEREVQRTFMQLLGEIDGFKSLDNVKIIGATNRLDILDEAITRPGRFERHIQIKEPNKEGRLEILKIHTKKMSLEKNVNLEKVAEDSIGFSGARIKALATEAGYQAIRNNRKKIKNNDFEKAIIAIKANKKEYNLVSSNYD
jgi:proteasome regulatory subunit